MDRKAVAMAMSRLVDTRPSNQQFPKTSVALPPRNNSLLAALSEADRRRLAPFCERELLQCGTIVSDIGDEIRHAYFPVRGMLSLHGMTTDGTLIQIAAIDSTGVVAASLFPDGVAPYRTAATLPCEAYKMRSAVLVEECKRNSGLDSLIRAFRNRYATQIGQTAVCHHFHGLGKRLCRWLLICADCARSDTIELTQERLAQMLGASRESVSRVATRLQDQSLIRQRHGRIKILNRPGLIDGSCDCYTSDRHLVSAKGNL